MRTLPELLEAIRVKDYQKHARGYFGTASGHAAYILDPENSHVSLTDIAVCLARIPRFGGHQAAGQEPTYTVAQHCVLTSHLVSDENKLLALLHDATEAYLGDVISPLKALLPTYKQIEREWAMAIGRKLGLGSKLAYLPEEVKRADLTMLASEHFRFRKMDPEGAQWLEDYPESERVRITHSWDEVTARRRFVNRYVELTHLEPT